MVKVDATRFITDNIGLTTTATYPISKQKLVELGPSSSEETALIRLLLGTASICSSSGAVIVESKTNYSILGAPPCRIRSASGLEILLNNLQIDIAALDIYLQRSAIARKSFYIDLLSEITHHLERSQTGQGVVAFLHLYRFLERVSYAFPILYAYSNDDFKGMFDSFRAFIRDDKAGELNFFTNFLDKSIDAALLDSTVSINLSALLPSDQKPAFDIIHKFVKTEHIVSETKYMEIEIKSRALAPLLITLRNRFFHFTSGHKDNISLTSIPDPDAFFTSVNAIFLNWLAVIYFYTVRAKAERYTY